MHNVNLYKFLRMLAFFIKCAILAEKGVCKFMAYDNGLVVGKLRRWEHHLKRYRLPDWEELPDFGLYMEQVVQLLTQYLSFLPPDLRQPQPVTAAVINNYVRTNLLPEPKKKRYYRIHLAYLLMICTLKQSLRLSMLPALLPGNLPEEDVRHFYTAFVRRHRLCAQYFIDQVKLTAAAMLDEEVCSELAVTDPSELVVSAAVLSGFTRLLAEKLLLLEGKTLADGGSLELEP